ncbi:myelin regulatory factor isoform X3 [Oceanobacillus picturae]|uniref:Myelin regulatory factor isoform X3 n=1 Tax=Oceanobacillus picturae TaxID=171693 RepID=A0A0U9H743_9BACI|nr:myelin regulatory factor isoform X3 [Oceanobacillus picturae]
MYLYHVDRQNFLHMQVGEYFAIRRSGQIMKKTIKFSMKNSPKD